MLLLGRSQSDMPNREDADVELAKKIAQVAQIRRKEKLDALKDYTGFVVNTLVGMTLVISGFLGEFVPTILPSKISSNPEAYIALGLTCFIGKGILTIFAKIANSLKP